MNKAAIIISAILVFAGVAAAGALPGLSGGASNSPTVETPTLGTTTVEDDGQAGVDISGPCDEAEHANDPALHRRRADDHDDGRGRRSGRRGHQRPVRRGRARERPALHRRPGGTTTATAETEARAAMTTTPATITAATPAAAATPASRRRRRRLTPLPGLQTRRPVDEAQKRPHPGAASLTCGALCPRCFPGLAAARLDILGGGCAAAENGQNPSHAAETNDPPRGRRDLRSPSRSPRHSVAKASTRRSRAPSPNRSSSQRASTRTSSSWT